MQVVLLFQGLRVGLMEATSKVDSTNLRHQYGTLPVRIWENELEELQFYLKRLKKALTRQDTSEHLKAALQQIRL